MVQLSTARSSNAALVESQPLVVVVVGGTAGIGEYAVRGIAATHAKNAGKGLRLYVVGRRKAAADKIIADCENMCPKETFQFVQATDLSLLSDVDKACAEITKSERKVLGEQATPKIDLLVMTQGYVTLDTSRHETSEGLDALMAITYYGRMRFIHQFLPLLTASPIAGRVVSVWNPRLEGKVIPDDLSLRQPGHFGFRYGSSHIAQMTHFFHENIARRNPGRIALSHYYPGFVRTNAIDRPGIPKFVRWLWVYVVDPLVKRFAVPEEDSGQWVMFHASSRFPARNEQKGEARQAGGQEPAVAMASDGTVGGGAYRTTWNGEIIATGKAYSTAQDAGFYEKTWAHTMKVFETIEAGKMFEE